MENQSEMSVIAQYHTCDFIKYCGGILKIDIYSNQINYVYKSHSEYNLWLDKCKRNAKEVDIARTILKNEIND